MIEDGKNKLLYSDVVLCSYINIDFHISDVTSSFEI